MDFSHFRSRPRSGRVAVIGTGIGGLVAGLELAVAGLDVTLFDRAPAPGGKLREVDVLGQKIDAGPTVFTLRGIFDDIFSRAGTSLDDCLEVRTVDVLARHAWRAGEHLDLFADKERTIEAIGSFAGRAEAAGYRDFCRRAARMFKTLDAPFMQAASPSMAKLVGAVGLGRDLWNIAPFTTLWRALDTHFNDPRLKQLFGRYATYCGSSPFAAPATLMLISHVERLGVWVISGGMHRLASELTRLIRLKGGTLRFGTEVHSIMVEGGRAVGVTLAGGEPFRASTVISNADVAALGAGLFGAAAHHAVPKARIANRSLSALTFALSAPTAGFPLERHNVFFSNDYKAEFEDLFGHHRLPGAPTVYVCAQDRDGGVSPPEGRPERLFCIVNAPATGDSHSFDKPEIASCAERTFSLLHHCGLEIQRRPGDCLATTPNDFAQLFPATGGAIYGAAAHGAMASFRRPGGRSRLPGLYLCGGSVHPGPGIPMAALSGRMTAASVLADLASMPLWRGAAMPGGMSTA